MKCPQCKHDELRTWCWEIGDATTWLIDGEFNDSKDNEVNISGLDPLASIRCEQCNWEGLPEQTVERGEDCIEIISAFDHLLREEHREFAQYDCSKNQPEDRERHQMQLSFLTVLLRLREIKPLPVPTPCKA